jgi:hypothetical protein
MDSMEPVDPALLGITGAASQGGRGVPDTAPRAASAQAAMVLSDRFVEALEVPSRPEEILSALSRVLERLPTGAASTPSAALQRWTLPLDGSPVPLERLAALVEGSSAAELQTYWPQAVREAVLSGLTGVHAENADPLLAALVEFAQRTVAALESGQAPPTPPGTADPAATQQTPTAPTSPAAPPDANGAAKQPTPAAPPAQTGATQAPATGTAVAVLPDRTQRLLQSSPQVSVLPAQAEGAPAATPRTAVLPNTPLRTMPTQATEASLPNTPASNATMTAARMQGLPALLGGAPAALPNQASTQTSAQALAQAPTQAPTETPPQATQTPLPAAAIATRPADAPEAPAAAATPPQAAAFVGRIPAAMVQEGLVPPPVMDGGSPEPADGTAENRPAPTAPAPGAPPNAAPAVPTPLTDTRLMTEYEQRLLESVARTLQVTRPIAQNSPAPSASLFDGTAARPAAESAQLPAASLPRQLGGERTPPDQASAAPSREPMPSETGRVASRAAPFLERVEGLAATAERPAEGPALAFRLPDSPASSGNTVLRASQDVPTQATSGSVVPWRGLVPLSVDGRFTPMWLEMEWRPEQRTEDRAGGRTRGSGAEGRAVTLSMDLDSPVLGKVSFRLIWMENELAGSVRVQRADVTEEARKELPSLREGLNAAGLPNSQWRIVGPDEGFPGF